MLYNKYNNIAGNDDFTYHQIGSNQSLRGIFEGFYFLENKSDKSIKFTIFPDARTTSIPRI